MLQVEIRSTAGKRLRSTKFESFPCHTLSHAVLSLRYFIKVAETVLNTEDLIKQVPMLIKTGISKLLIHKLNRKAGCREFTESASSVGVRSVSSGDQHLTSSLEEHASLRGYIIYSKLDTQRPAWNTLNEPSHYPSKKRLTERNGLGRYN